MGHNGFQGPVIPFDQALPIRSAGPKIHDIKVEAAAAITCECPAGVTFITRLTDPGVCPACRRRYPIDAIKVTPTRPGAFEISVNVQTQVPTVTKD